MRIAGLRDLAAHQALKVLPATWCSQAGALISHIPRLALPNTHLHLKTLFAALRPEWRDDPVALEKAARRCWNTTARTYAEMSVAWRMMRKGFASFDNVERVDTAMSSGRPVILLFIHTGSWEMAGMQLALRFPHRILAVYEPRKNPAQTRIAMSVRRKLPADFVAMSSLVWRHAVRKLGKPGGSLWIAADEFAFGRVHAPFFGRPPRYDGNLGKVARLAIRTGAIVVPLYSERHLGPRFKTHILEPMTFAPSDEPEQAVHAMEAVFAPIVIRLIDQWYMALYYHDYASLPL